MARKSRRRTRRRRKMRGGGLFDTLGAAVSGATSKAKDMFGLNRKPEEDEEEGSDEIVKQNASPDLSQPQPSEGQDGGRRRRRRSRKKRRKSKRRRSRKRRRTRKRRRRRRR